MEEDLVAQLLADAGLSALVGDRITWNLRDQAGALPAVVLHLIDATRQRFLGGRRSGFEGAYLQADCWGSTFAEAKDVSRAFRAALDNLTGAFRGSAEEHERDDAFLDPAPVGHRPAELHRTSLDVRVWRQAP